VELLARNEDTVRPGITKNEARAAFAKATSGGSIRLVVKKITRQ